MSPPPPPPNKRSALFFNCCLSVPCTRDGSKTRSRSTETDWFLVPHRRTHAAGLLPASLVLISNHVSLRNVSKSLPEGGIGHGTVRVRFVFHKHAVEVGEGRGWGGGDGGGWGGGNGGGGGERQRETDRQTVSK